MTTYRFRELTDEQVANWHEMDDEEKQRAILIPEDSLNSLLTQSAEADNIHTWQARCGPKHKG